MDQEQLRAWLKGVLKQLGRTRRELGELLTGERSSATKIFNGQRRINLEDLARLRREWNVAPPDGPGTLTRYADRGVIPVRARIARHTWIAEHDTAGLRETSGHFDNRYPISDQSAFQIDAPSRQGERYEVGDFVITVPFSSYRPRLLVGDVVVTRRRRDGLVSYDLKRAVEVDGRVSLKPILEGSEDADDEEPYGLVIALQTTSNL